MCCEDIQLAVIFPCIAYRAHILHTLMTYMKIDKFRGSGALCSDLVTKEFEGIFFFI